VRVGRGSSLPDITFAVHRAGSTALWVVSGVLFGHSRTSAALLDGETVVDGSLTSVGGGGRNASCSAGDRSGGRPAAGPVSRDAWEL
jgi:hypothetical protein